MKQRKNKCIGPLCAGYLALALVATAAEQSLPTPPPSEFVDMESSATVPIPTDQGRRIKLTLDFESTPSNAVQVAFGRDLNADDDLAPEETEVVVGCDCGVPIVRDEVKVEGEGVAVKVEGEGEQWNCDHHCSPSPLTFTLKQPKSGFARSCRRRCVSVVRTRRSTRWRLHEAADGKTSRADSRG